MSESTRKELMLPGSLTIADVTSLKSEWVPLIDEASDLAINTDAVQRADGAGLQLLLTAVQAIRAKDGLVTWSSPTGPVATVASTLGMTDQLGLK